MQTYTRRVPFLRFLNLLAAIAALLLGLGTVALGQTAHVGAGVVVVATNSFNSEFTPEGLALDAAGNVYNGNDAALGIDKSTFSNGAYTTASLNLLPSDLIFGLNFDSNGVLYAANESGGTIYKLTLSNGTWTAAQIITGLGATSGVAVDGFGNIYTNDYGSTLYKYTLAGGVYTQHVIASNFELTRGIAVDSNGVIYQTDEDGAKLRVFTPNGPVQTTFSYTEGAGFAIPDTTGVAVRNGIIYLGATTALYEETPNGSGGYTQSKINFTFEEIRGLAPDGSGNVFVADYLGQKIYKVTTVLPDFGSVAVGATSAAQTITFDIDTAGAVGGVKVLTQGVANSDFALQSTTCAGTLAAGGSCAAEISFTPKQAGEAYGAVELTNAAGAVIATALIQGDGTAPQVTYTPGIITTAAGASGFSQGQNVVIDPAGTMYLASSANGTIYKISGGTQSVYASGFNTPTGLALDGAGNLYVAEPAANDVKVINHATLAVAVIPGGTGLGGASALAVDGSGNVYVAESTGNEVITITPAGVATKLAGTGTGGYNGDNIQATTAELNNPTGIGIDANGNVYIADTGNERVRKISSAGVISTLAGTGSAGYGGDGGLGTAAAVNAPAGQIVVDAGGNVYFDDAGNNVIRKVLAGTGAISTIAGTGTAGNTGDNGAATSAQLNNPLGLTMDGGGNVYVSDSGNGSIREIGTAPAPYTFQNSYLGIPSSDSPFLSTLTNIGNEALALPAPSAGVNPSLASGFLFAPGSTCPQVATGATAGSLAAGASCSNQIEFVAQAVGAVSGSLITTDNNNNVSGSTQTLGLSGTGQPLLIKTITFPQPGAGVYGGSAALTATTSNGDSVTYAVNSGSAVLSGATLGYTGVGTVSVTASSGAAGDYAAATPVTINISVGPAPLTITPAPAAMMAGGTVPAISPTAVGLVNGDGLTTLGAVTCTTTATSSSAAGSYPSSCTGASDPNYAIVYVPGTLTVYANSAVLPTEPVGASSPNQTVDFVLSSSTTVTSYAVVTQGATGLDFNPAASQAGDVCAAGTYAAGASCSVSVVFTPTTAGTREGAVILYSGNTVLGTVYLTGLGQAPLGLFSSPTTAWTVSGFDVPRGISLDGAGNLYIANTSANQVEEIKAGTTTPTLVANISIGTGATAVDGAGNLYVVSNNLGALYEWVNGSFVQIATGINPDDNLEVDGFGNLYTSNYNTAAIYKISAGNPGTQRSVTTLFGGLSGRFIGMALDPAGDIFAADFDHDVLYELPVGTHVLTTLVSGDGHLASPHAVALDPAGNIYVGNDSANTSILRYAAGTYSETTLPATGSRSIAFDGQGNIYTVTNDTTISEYTRTAPPTDTFATTAYAATSLAASVEFENDGNAPLAISSYAATTNFGTSGPAGTCATGSMAAGATCFIGPSFTPQALGPLTGAINIADNSLNQANAMQVLNLSGTAVPAAQTISFALASPVLYGASPITLGASASSGLAVSYTITSGSQFGTLSNGVLTITGAGSITIQASQAGNADYTAAAPVNQSLLVSPAPLTVTASNGTMIYGAAAPLITPSYSGFVNHETSAVVTTAPVCTTTATSLSPVAGSYTSSCAGGAAANYALVYASGAVSINPAALAITASSGTMIYGTTAPAITAGYNGFVNGENATVLGTVVCTTVATNASTVGNHASNCSGAADANYAITYISGSISVTPATPVLSWANGAITYGQALDAAARPTANIPGRFGYTANGSPVTGHEVLAAGSYSQTATFTPADTLDYTTDTVGNALTVSPAALSITASNGTMIYGTAAPAITPSYSGLVNGESAAVLGAVTCATTAASTSTVGSYPSSCAGAVDANYAIAYVGGSVSVTPATPVLNWANGTITYGAAADTAARPTANVPGRFAYTANGNPVTGHEVMAAGSYSQIATFTPADTLDYTATTVNNTLIVNPAALSITASNGTMLYGTAAPVITPSYNGFVNSDTATNLGAVTCSTVATGTSPVGSYSSSCTGAVDSNYTFRYVNGSVSVTPAALTITASGGTMTYGGTVPGITASYSGLAAGDTAASLTQAPACSTLATGTSPIGSYGSGCAGAVDANYTIGYVPGSVTVTPAALAVTASNGTMIYGGTVPAITASYSGFVNGNSAATLTTPPTCSTVATGTSGVGSYGSSCTGAVIANYTINYVAGSVAVTPAPLTITASNGTMVYGANAPLITPGYAGLVAGNTAASLTAAPNCSTVANGTTGVGSYGSSCTGAADANYTISYVAGAVTVTPAALTITASSASLAYGGTAAITPIYSGLVAGNTGASLTAAPVCTTTATNTSVPGSYPSSCAGAVDANYTIGYRSGSVTISKATLTVAANAVTCVYGTCDGDNDSDDVVKLTYAITGFANGQTAAQVLYGMPSESTNIAENAAAAVGTYPITMAPGSLRVNSANAALYTLVYANSTYTITPATITVTATSQTDVYGQVDPDRCGKVAPHLTYTISGLAWDEPQFWVLNGQPSETTTAVPGSSVGAYPITITTGTQKLIGPYAADYTIVYVNGNVNVTPAKLFVVANSYSRQINAANPAFGYTVNGFVEGDTQATALTGAPAFGTSATSASPAGDYTITIGAGTLAANNGNYTFQFVNGLLIVYNLKNPFDPHCDGFGHFRANPFWDYANWPDAPSLGFYWGGGWQGGGPNVVIF